MALDSLCRPLRSSGSLGRARKAIGAGGSGANGRSADPGNRPRPRERPRGELLDSGSSAVLRELIDSEDESPTDAVFFPQKMAYIRASAPLRFLPRPEPVSLVYIALGATPGSPLLRILTALYDLFTSRASIFSICIFVDALVAISNIRVLVRYVCTR